MRGDLLRVVQIPLGPPFLKGEDNQYVIVRKKPPRITGAVFLSNEQKLRSGCFAGKTLRDVGRSKSVDADAFLPRPGQLPSKTPPGTEGQFRHILF